jgi:hypothetical protein
MIRRDLWLCLLALLGLSLAVCAAPDAPAPRLILAHRMLGFGPHFAPDGREPYGFLFPVKDPKGAEIAGWCREGHLGALHPKFASRVEEFKWEIRQAMAGGVDGFVLDTCGGTHEFGVPDAMLKASEELGGTFKIGLCLDYGALPNAKKAESVKAWIERYGTSPAILRLNGVPAFATYGIGYKPVEQVKTLFQELRDAAGQPIYLCLDLTEFPNKPPTEWESQTNAYAQYAEGISCFYSRQSLERNAQAFAVMSTTCRALGKDWSMCPWPNYYTPGRTAGMENIGADNSRYWDRMWQIVRDTKPDYLQLTTWNDITEDTTIMPGVRRHFTFVDLLGHYYGPWYKTGVEPKAPRDQVYVFYRPYRTDARRPLIAGPRAAGSATQDQLEVRCFLTKPGVITVAGMGTQAVPAGMSSIEFPSKPGTVSITLTRGRKTVFTFIAPEEITDRPWRQDLAIRGFSSEEAAHWTRWFPGQAPAYISEYGDTDGNGLPNWFERYYFGQWTGVDPTADPDGDGQTTLQEYRAGTDPRNLPKVYPAGFRWDFATDFRPRDETYPVPDALKTPVWECEFRSLLDKTTTFAPARLLVSQIPAWLERGNSWSFGIGKPVDGSVAYFGEADSASAQGWISPVTGRVAMEVQVGKELGGGPFAVTLTRDGEATPLWSTRFDPAGEPSTFARELPLTVGDRLRVTVAGPAGAGRWAVRVRWGLTYLGAAR